MPAPRDVDWDLVEELVFQCLELRANDATGAAAAIETLLHDKTPSIANEVRRALANVAAGDSTRSDAQSDARRELRLPERLGPYRLERCLGQGGMGAVFEAVDDTLGRRVACKVVRPDLLAFGQGRERFRREIEAVARLSHPGIVPVYQVGEDDGVPWYTMELVAGASLATVLQRLAKRDPTRLTGDDLRLAAFGGVAPQSGSSLIGSWERICLRLAHELAEALTHAHGRSVLHRDVKPSNVVLDAAGHARLIDFGLARAEDSAELTHSGAMIGSLPYLPPERLRGDRTEFDARGDVYALGVTMFELLALRSPFLAEHEAATRANIEAGEAPPLRRCNRALSWEAVTVVGVAMDRDPARRYQSMAEFAADLQRVLDHLPIVARPPSAWRRLHRFGERHPVAVVVALGIVVIAALYTFSLRSERDSAVAAQQESERLRQVDRLLAYRSSVQAAHLALRLGRAGAAREQLARCPEDLRAFEWHHLERQVDESLATFAGGDGFVRRVAVTDLGIFAINADGYVRLLSPDDGKELRRFGTKDIAMLALAASRDGAHVVTGHLDHKARLWDGRTGELRGEYTFDALYGEHPPLPHQRSMFAVALDDDARTAYLASNGGAVLVVDVATAKVTGGFVLPVQRGGPFALAVSPDGKTLAAAVDHVVRLLTPSGEVLRTLTGHRGFVYSLQFSRDGKTLLSASQDRTARLWSVADGLEGTVFTGHDGEVFEAAFDEHGRVWTVSSDSTLRAFDAESGNELQRRLGHSTGVYGLAVTPGSARIVTGGVDGTVRLWDPESGHARRRLGGAGRTLYGLVLHPDGAACTAIDQGHGARTFALPDGSERPPLLTASVRLLAMHGERIATANGVEVRVQPGDVVCRGAEGELERLAFADDGALFGAETSGQIVIWPASGMASGAAVGKRAAAHDGEVRVLIALPDGAVSAGIDGKVLRWRTNGDHRELLHSQTEWEAGASSPDHRLLYLAGAQRLLALDLGDGEVRWDREIVARLRGVATISAGRRLLGAGTDRVLHVFDSNDGEELLGLPASNVLQSVIAVGDVAVTATVYSELDLWLGK